MIRQRSFLTKILKNQLIFANMFKRSYVKLNMNNLISLSTIKNQSININNKNMNMDRLNSYTLYGFCSSKPAVSQKQQIKVPFVFSLQQQPQLLKLQLQYRSLKNIQIFESVIKSSSSLLQQMKIFKIFKIMQTTQYSHESYNKFYQIITQSINKKSDNLLLLLATIKQRISRHYKNIQNFSQSIYNLQQSLDILQNCMIPPLFPYYSIYRQYGLLQYQLNQFIKAKQILIESVQILNDFVSHSDDNVSTNDYSKKQAMAYNVLTKVDQQNKQKWIEKAMNQWEKVLENKNNQIEYAKTIAEKYKQQYIKDKQKAQALYHFNIYNFQNQQMKNILKQAKEQINNINKSN